MDSYSETLNSFLMYSRRDSTLEFEVRIRDVTSAEFYKCLAVFSRAFPPQKPVESTEQLYTAGRGCIKCTTDSRMYKETIKSCVVHDSRLKLALSIEQPVGFDVQLGKLSCIRKKSRRSFKTNYVTIDFTVVNETHYEIELEFVRPLPLNFGVGEIKQNIDFLLKTLQHGTIRFVGLSETRTVLKEYLNVFKTVLFAGAQPETLHHRHIPLVKDSTKYLVTPKIDGDRCLLFVYRNTGYIIDSNASTVTVAIESLKEESRVSVFDAERVHGKVFLFDTLFYNGVDVRKFVLKDRLQLATQFVSQVPQNRDYTVTVKEYFTSVGNVIVPEGVQTDGYIFVPIDEPYPVTRKWPGLLKWKPADKTTIDFYSVNVRDDTWELRVKNATDTYPVLFSPQESTTFPNGTVDPSTGLAFKTGTVIEYSWDGKRFVPLRTRWDKTANPRKHGNFETVAMDIFKSILNSVSLDLLL